jgi:hypothetical protein
MQVKNKVNEQANESKKAFASIETKSFIVVVLLLGALLAISGILSYVIPQGSFLRDECGTIIEGSYTRNEEQGGIPVWRVITAPFRVFASEDAMMIIIISVFLLVMSGIFNLLEKTNGTKVVIGRLMSKLAVLEDYERGYAENAEFLGKLGLVINVNLYNRYVGSLLGYLVDYRCEHLARTAPACEKVYKNDTLVLLYFIKSFFINYSCFHFVSSFRLLLHL